MSATLSSQDEKDIWTLTAIGTTAAVLLVGGIAYWLYSSYSVPKDVQRADQLQRSLDATRLVENYRWQVEILGRLPRPWVSWTSMKPYVWENAASLASLAALVVSVVLLITGFLLSPWVDDRDDILSAGMLTFTLSSNLFVIFRQVIYYQEKQRVGGAAAVDAGFMPASTIEDDYAVPAGAIAPLAVPPSPSPLASPQLPPRRERQSAAVPSSPSLGPAAAVAKSRPRTTTNGSSTGSGSATPSTSAARLQAYTTATQGGTGAPQLSLTLDDHTLDIPTFYSFNWTFRNALQVLIIIVEFIQLISFPLRDLFNNPALVSSPGTSTMVKVFDNVIRIFTLIPDQFSARILFQVQFWGCFTVILLGLAVAAGYGVAKHKYNRDWPLEWVFTLVPFASIFYLPVLVTFVSSAACITQTSYKSQALRCNNQLGNEVLYFVCSMVGFVASYLLLTLFLSSDERRPVEGDITFKSSSVAFMKNMGFLLVIVSLLIPAQKPVVRGLLSLIIIMTMCAYNIRKRPCYVYSINFLRTGTLSMILWATTVVTLLNDIDILTQVGPKTLWISFGLGWSALIALFIVTFRVHMRVRDLKLRILLPNQQQQRAGRGAGRVSQTSSGSGIAPPPMSSAGSEAASSSSSSNSSAATLVVPASAAAGARVATVGRPPRQSVSSNALQRPPLPSQPLPDPVAIGTRGPSADATHFDRRDLDSSSDATLSEPCME
ncbi:hypothetical protein H9P43_001238 [Blastocladiella emersonii ATCC 22665]|nr:hypothetical protein H9P43_001238 [Blastocladiella emersonii ATCC 22665]